MSALIKLSSLTDAEKLNFARLDGKKGRYVLAKKMQTRDWDTGSVWQLVKGAEGLCIARCDDKPVDKNTVSSGVCVNKCTCGTMLKSASRGSYKADYCPKCQPDFNKGISKTASFNTPPEITEKVGTGISVGLTVTADYLNSKILPVATQWIQDGWDDFTVEGVQKRVITAVKANELTSTDAELFQDQAERVAAWSSQFAMSSQDEGLFAHAGQKDAAPEFTKSMSKFAAMKPEGMSWDKFISCYKTLTATDEGVKTARLDEMSSMQKKASWGERSPRKIEIYADGKYVCTTTQSKTLAEVVAKFKANPVVQGRREDGLLGPLKYDVSKVNITAGFVKDASRKVIADDVTLKELRRAIKNLNAASDQVYAGGYADRKKAEGDVVAARLAVDEATRAYQAAHPDMVGIGQWRTRNADGSPYIKAEGALQKKAFHDDGLVTITISLANAAFGDNAGPECARILRKLADQFDNEGGVGDVSLRDINGNRCGQVSVTGGAGDFAIPDDADEGESRLGRESSKGLTKVK